MPGVRRKPAPPVEASVDCSDQAHMAIKALAVGNANGDQQRVALKWIVELAAGTYDQPFRPGVGGDRDTAFACGRMFVGQQIVKQINTVRQAQPK
jgi:hypothetical protein